VRGLVIVLGLALAGCSPVKEEVERVPSPDGALDAVVIRVNAGATVSFYYDVYVVPAGSKAGGREVADFYGLYSTDGWAEGVRPVWVDDGALQLRFDKARQGNLRQRSVEVAGRRIEVECIGSVEMPDFDDQCAVTGDRVQDNLSGPRPSVDVAS
jgi:hypothetical protein